METGDWTGERVEPIKVRFRDARGVLADTPPGDDGFHVPPTPVANMKGTKPKDLPAS